jgi:DNA end-binding protein Ku
MPRAMWSGVIGFGMVSIPIKLYAATENRNVSFHQLHATCQTRIKEVRWCPTCDREVPWEEVQKGFEYSKGDYVMLDDEDLKKLPIPSKDTIDVSSFCTVDEVDPIYFEKHYYLEPEKNGKRPFDLFVKALVDKEMLGIASITLRTKERLCVLRPVGAHLVMSTLLYPDELRIDPSEELPEHKVTKQELDMATNLIDLLSEDFEPVKYEDRYRAALMEMIEAKLEGQPIKKEKHRTAEGKVVDLLEALKNSVSNAKSGSKGAAAKKAMADDEEEEENVVQIKRGAKKTTTRKTSTKSAARTQKASGIGRLAKSRTKAAPTKKTAKTGAKSKSKKRSA